MTSNNLQHTASTFNTTDKEYGDKYSQTSSVLWGSLVSSLLRTFVLPPPLFSEAGKNKFKLQNSFMENLK